MTTTLREKKSEKFTLKFSPTMLAELRAHCGGKTFRVARVIRAACAEWLTIHGKELKA